MKIKSIITGIILATLLPSCGQDSNIADYTVKIHTDVTDTDSVKLLVYEPEYHSLRMLNKGKLKNGKVEFSGQISESLVAFVKIGKNAPISFILEQCETSLTIGKENAIVWGGIENHAYMGQCKRIYDLDKRIKSIELEYKRRIADSTLTKINEGKLLRAHKALANALRKTIYNDIKKNDNASLLLKEKFLNRLDSASLKSL